MRALRGSLCALCVALLGWVAAPASAQDDASADHESMQHEGMQAEMPEMSAEEQAMMAAWQKSMTPGPQHAALAEEAGDWNMQVKMWMEPGAEPTVSTATAHREMTMGGRILVENVEGDMMGMPFKGEGMTGYDNVTGKYWSTWIDNMGTGLMVGEGSWDDATDTGTFLSTASDPMAGSVKVKSVVKRVDADHQVIEMYDLRDGNERKTMEITATRSGS